MRKALTLVVFLSALSCSIAGAADTRAKDPDGTKKEKEADARPAIRWPGRTQTDLQSVIDAAPDGSTIRIAPGPHLIEQPIFVRGRRLRIEGAPWTRTEQPPPTRLLGRPPQRVVDERGEIRLPAAEVSGLLNVVGGEVVVSNLRLSGFDAGLVLRDDERGALAQLTADRLFIDGTGRGVLALSSGTLNLTHTTVVNTQWHGFSVGPAPQTPTVPPTVFVFDTKIIDPGGAGMYFHYATVGIQGCAINGAKKGGILASDVYSNFSITDCILLGNQDAGILIENMIASEKSPAIAVDHVDIEDTFPLAPFLQGGILGDGIVVMTDDPQRPAQASITNSFIGKSARAGISSFGSVVSISNTTLVDAAFDLDGEPGRGDAKAMDYTFHDLGFNKCGSFTPPTDYPRECKATSSQLQPPKAIAGSQ